ncbi:hypothetical protein ASSaV_gp28 [Abalone shriveling syndrome-associated virus]|uniref:hypothetical protein n=1 Tax=Abalone shriveling syndrome-associated virus TaxID=491893 RepID=UPI0001881BA8|nr:hypothetical protein ASSaV_gp28 [Abalone shriveling syndrome-associated virus]ACJ71977.1 unknown [Abalone shriveling syndrome-associated virus]
MTDFTVSNENQIENVRSSVSSAAVTIAAGADINAAPIPLFSSLTNNTKLIRLQMMSSAVVAGATKFTLELHIGNPDSCTAKILDNILAADGAFPAAAHKVETLEFGANWNVALGYVLDQYAEKQDSDGYTLVLRADAAVTNQVVLKFFFESMTGHYYRIPGTPKASFGTTYTKAS